MYSASSALHPRSTRSSSLLEQSGVILIRTTCPYAAKNNCFCLLLEYEKLSCGSCPLESASAPRLSSAAPAQTRRTPSTGRKNELLRQASDEEVCRESAAHMQARERQAGLRDSGRACAVQVFVRAYGRLRVHMSGASLRPLRRAPWLSMAGGQSVSAWGVTPLGARFLA